MFERNPVWRSKNSQLGAAIVNSLQLGPKDPKCVQACVSFSFTMLKPFD